MTQWLTCLASITVPTWLVGVAAILGALALIVTSVTVLRKPTVAGVNIVSDVVTLPAWKDAQEAQMKRLEELAEAVATLVEAIPVLQEVVEQVRTDGGSSIKDTTNRIDARADANEKLVKEVAARLEAHTEAVADRLAAVTEASEARHAAHAAWMEDYLSKFKHGNEGVMQTISSVLANNQVTLTEVKATLAAQEERASRDPASRTRDGDA